MTLPETRTIARVALWLALVYAAALAGPFLYATAVEGDGASLGGALIAATWTAAPVYAAAAIVGASPTRTGAWPFLALELALIVSFAWQFIASRHSSTGGFTFVGWPLLQFGVLVVAFMIALLMGWRMRPDFLRD